MIWRQEGRRAIGGIDDVARERNESTLLMLAVTLWRVTNHTQFIAIQIAEISAKIIGMVVRAQSRRPFADAALRQRSLVSINDLLPVTCSEGNHLSIAALLRLTIVGLADHKEGALAAGAVPAGPGLFCLHEAQLLPKYLH